MFLEYCHLHWERSVNILSHGVNGRCNKQKVDVDKKKCEMQF